MIDEPDDDTEPVEDDDGEVLYPDADPKNADWIARDGAYADDPDYNPPYRPDTRPTLHERPSGPRFPTSSDAPPPTPLPPE